MYLKNSARNYKKGNMHISKATKFKIWLIEKMIIRKVKNTARA